MSVHAALVGRAGPLGLGALLAGLGWLACGRIELGSHAGGAGPGSGNGGGGAVVFNGPGGGKPEGDLGVASATPTSTEGAAGAPVEVFGAADDGPRASEGGTSAAGDIDSNVVVLAEPDGGGLDAGDADAGSRDFL